MAKLFNPLPDKVQAARVLLGQGFPYFRSYLWAMAPIECHLIDTMAVDAVGRWYINPDFVEKLSVPDTALGIVHEIMHFISKHPRRLHAIERDVANVAGDLAINCQIEEMITESNRLIQAEYGQHNHNLPNFGAPDWWLHPRQYKFPEGLIAEQYVPLLLQHQQKTNSLMPECMCDKNGTGKGKSKKKCDCASKQSNKPGDKGQGSAGTGSCGSCSHGHKMEWEENPDKNGEVPAMSEAEAEMFRREIAHAIEEYKKTRGTIPGNLLRWAEEYLTPPKVSWTKELASSINRSRAYIAGNTNFTWSGLSRKLPRPFILPTTCRHVPVPAGIIDTSGSMSPTALAKALSESQGIIQACGFQKVPFICCDAAAYASKKVCNPKYIQLEGGGGTDMRIGIDAAMKLQPQPNIIIVLTDGYTPWPENPIPHTKVIAVLIEHKGSERPPSWIKSIEVDD